MESSSSAAATEEATDAEEDAAVRDDRRVARFGGMMDGWILSLSLSLYQYLNELVVQVRKVWS